MSKEYHVVHVMEYESDGSYEDLRDAHMVAIAAAKDLKYVKEFAAFMLAMCWCHPIGFRNVDSISMRCRYEGEWFFSAYKEGACVTNLYKFRSSTLLKNEAHFNVFTEYHFDITTFVEQFYPLFSRVIAQHKMMYTEPEYGECMNEYMNETVVPIADALQNLVGVGQLKKDIEVALMRGLI